MAAEGQNIDIRTYETNMQDKMSHTGFLSDLKPLMTANLQYDVLEAFELVQRKVIERL
jgi:hypothetical protein